MARKFVFPDPNDRSYNEPKVILDQPRVIGLFNQENNVRPKRQMVTQDVKEWFTNEAISRGWDTAEFVGNQCTLGVDLPYHGAGQ